MKIEIELTDINVQRLTHLTEVIKKKQKELEAKVPGMKTVIHEPDLYNKIFEEGCIAIDAVLTYPTTT